MTQENTFDWETETEEEERIFLSFKEENPIHCMFEETNPNIVDTKFGNKLYMFKVITPDGDKAYFSTSSKRCLSGLKQYLPLEGKQISILREGEGFDTTYSVVLITE